MTWLVTGGSRGIGKAVVDKVAKAGGHVAVLARGPATTPYAVPDLVREIPCDVTSSEDVAAAVAINSMLWNTARFVGPAIRLFVKKGLYSGDPLEDWIYDKLAAKGVRTFADLEPGRLRIIASDITQGKMLVLPDDISKYGIDPQSFEVAKAIRMSTSLPYFFDPVVLRMAKTSDGGGKSRFRTSIYIVDGGLLSNFPLWLFDPHEPNTPITPTLGFQLVGKNGKATREIRGPLTMLQALIATMLDAHDERYIESHNRFRTIKIPTLGVQTTEFELSPERSQQLFESGYRAAKAYLENWSASKYLNEYDKILHPRNL